MTESAAAGDDGQGPVCEEPLVYAGTGRRPRYCSPACRTRAWAMRRYAAAVAGEGLDDVDVDERAGPAGAAPTTARGWAAALDELSAQLLAGPLGRAGSD